MAANLIPMDQSKPLPREIVSCLKQLIDGRERLRRVIATFVQHIDGDGSQASHFDLSVLADGFDTGDYATDSAAAKASFDELNSLYAKLSTDASVTDVSTALSQAAAKHGVV